MLSVSVRIIPGCVLLMVRLPVNVAATPVIFLASISINVDTPETFTFPFKSNSVAVMIPVRLTEGTSNAPNNLPFNTKSPSIVCEDAAPTIAFCTVNLSNT